MPKSTKSGLSYERLTLDNADALRVRVGGETIIVNLMHGMSAEARAALVRHGVDVEALLAAVWSED